VNDANPTQDRRARPETLSAVEADFAKRLGWTPNRANQIWETNPGYKARAKDFSQITTGAMRS
jgi:hypothetical protein